MVGKPLCDVGALTPNMFTQGHIMKIKWLVADVAVVESPDIAESSILGVILAGRCFGPFRQCLWPGSRFVM